MRRASFLPVLLRKNAMQKKTNPALLKLVTLLRDGAYHDGNTLGEHLAITRSAVWKMIKKLQQYGIHLDSVKAKGYALLEPLILLDAQKIKKHLHDKKIELTILESTSSTNDYLRQQSHKKGIKVCLAEEQTHGRGRLARHWYSPFGRNIYLSCLFPLQKDVSALAGLSLVISLVIKKTLNEFGIQDHLFVKWPNDVLYDGKKLSGCLIDIQAETYGYSKAIIGIGLNVNMLQDDHQINQGWLSMQKILGAYVDRNQLAISLINNLMHYLQCFEQQGFAAFVAEWTQADCLTQHLIRLNNLGQEVEGRVIGVNEQGLLILQLKNGHQQAFSAGDTSILKKS